MRDCNSWNNINIIENVFLLDVAACFAFVSEGIPAIPMHLSCHWRHIQSDSSGSSKVLTPAAEKTLLLPVPVPAPRFSATFCKWWRYSRTQPFRQHLSPPVARGILLCICRGKMSINCGNASECPYIVSQSSDLRFAEKTSSKKRFDFCLNCNMSMLTPNAAVYSLIFL